MNCMLILVYVECVCDLGGGDVLGWIYVRFVKLWGVWCVFWILGDFSFVG